MKKIYYEKVGRRYRPVSEYDSDLLDALPKGAHLILSYPGGRSTRHNIDPAYAPMIAAGRVAEDAISAAIVQATELRLQYKDRNRKLTDGQRAAWENLVKEFGDSARQLEWPSAREAAEAGVAAIQEEALKLMENENIAEAFAQFVTFCELARTNKKVDE